MEFNIDVQTAVITHPKFNEIKVTIKKLDEVEKMEYFSELQKYTIPIALREEDGTLIYDKKDKIAVFEQQRVPLTSVVDFLNKIIVKIEGITGKGGVTLSLKKQIKLLFDKKLSWTEPNPDYNPKDKESLKELEVPYWSHIQSKSLEDETFDTDPTVNS